MRHGSKLLTRSLIAVVALTAVASASGLIASCSASDEPNTTGTQGGTGGSGGSGASTGGPDASDDGSLSLDGSSGPFKDFPEDPVVDPALPLDPSGIFGADVPGGAAPCLTEPPVDAMFPTNWTPLLFEWQAPAGQNVFELRLHVDNQINDLVVYTDQPRYAMPLPMWQSLALHSAGHDITVTLRSGEMQGGALVNGPTTGTTGDLHIAPVPAPGSVVYWTTSGGSALKGFPIGAETVTTVIAPSSINDGTSCVGCHTSSPDGKLAFLSRAGATPSFSVAGRLVDGTAGPATAADISPNAAALLMRYNQTLPTLSKAHYAPNDAVVLTVLNDASTANRFEIVWTDLHAESGGTGILARTGDPRQAATPAFSHDGELVAYTSTDEVIDGRTSAAPTDVYVVPYNNRQGGQAIPLPGASDPNMHEYYPVFSPGDDFIAFNRAPLGVNSYDQAQSEIYLVSVEGGELTRIAGNDPAACTGVVSPGITNSWARWAPEAKAVGDTRYHWLVFSSKRRGGVPQLFISAVVTSVSGGAEVLEKTYPAIYVASQPAAEANHTPAWDVFQIEPPQ